MLKRQPFLIQLFDLTLVQLSNWRWAWRNMVIIGTIIPLISMIALGLFFARGRDQESIIYIYLGSIMLALLFIHQGHIAGNFAFMSAHGTLNYVATLPVYRSTFILSTLISFFLLFLPSLLVIMLIGAAILAIPLHPHVLVILIIPLITVPLAGIGALIGTSSRRIEEAASFSQLITLILLGLGPVLVPATQLPEILVFLGRFNPTTYAVSAMQQVLLGPISGQLVWDVVVLFAFALGSLWLVSRRMDWRHK